MTNRIHSTNFIRTAGFELQLFPFWSMSSTACCDDTRIVKFKVADRMVVEKHSDAQKEGKVA